MKQSRNKRRVIRWVEWKKREESTTFAGCAGVPWQRRHAGPAEQPGQGAGAQQCSHWRGPAAGEAPGNCRLVCWLPWLLPGSVAWHRGQAYWQTRFSRGCSTNTFNINSFIHWVTESSFFSKTSKYHKSQTVRARDMNFWDNVHHPLFVMCHMSCVAYHFFLQSGWTSSWRVCYRWGLPRLVCSLTVSKSPLISKDHELSEQLQLLRLLLAKPNSVLPSRSALSDLGLIADLFEILFQNWSSFCLKSPFFCLKSPKSLIFTVFSFTHKAENYLKISLTTLYLQSKYDLLNVRIKFLEQVWFWTQNSKFGSAFGLIFGRNVVW